MRRRLIASPRSPAHTPPQATAAIATGGVVRRRAARHNRRRQRRRRRAPIWRRGRHRGRIVVVEARADVCESESKQKTAAVRANADCVSFCTLATAAPRSFFVVDLKRCEGGGQKSRLTPNFASADGAAAISVCYARVCTRERARAGSEKSRMRAAPNHLKY